MNKHIIRISIFILALITLQSCFVSKEYTRPTVTSSSYFRSDALPQDSVSLAAVSWRDLFTDTTLVQYIEEGLEHNIDIRVAMQQMAAANAYYLRDKAGYLPSLNVNGQVTHQKLAGNSQFGSFFDGSITQYELSAALAWEADIWGKIRSNKRAGHAAYLQSRESHQAVKTELVSRIATTYFQLLALDEQRKVVTGTIINRENSLETTKALKDAGLLTAVAVKQTEAQLYTAQGILIDLTRNTRLLENTLSVLLGREPGPITRSSMQADMLSTEVTSVGYPIQLLRNRPDVRAAEAGLVNAFELTNVAKSNFYPTLRITSTGGLQSLELDKLLSVNSLFANMVAGLAQPVFNGRRIKSAYEVALAQKEIAYLNFKRAMLTATQEVSDGLYALQAAEEKIEVKSKEFDAYDLASDYSEELLDNGLANYLEVLRARENTLNSQMEIIQARLNKLTAQVQVYRALGGGWQ